MSQITAQLEALLFLAGDAVTKKDIARLLKITLAEVETVITDLQTILTNRGLAIVTTPTHVQLTTSPTVSTYLQEFLQGETGGLSAAAAETLALIAYRGPISRQDIEAIRGVDSRRMVRQLRTRGLIHSTTETGQFPLYSITPEFLQHLGLQRREDLPRFTDLSDTASVQELLSSD